MCHGFCISKKKCAVVKKRLHTKVIYHNGRERKSRIENNAVKKCLWSVAEVGCDTASAARIKCSVWLLNTVHEERAMYCLQHHVCFVNFSTWSLTVMHEWDLIGLLAAQLWRWMNAAKLLPASLIPHSTSESGFFHGFNAVGFHFRSPATVSRWNRIKHLYLSHIGDIYKNHMNSKDIKYFNQQMQIKQLLVDMQSWASLHGRIVAAGGGVRLRRLFGR